MGRKRALLRVMFLRKVYKVCRYYMDDRGTFASQHTEFFHFRCLLRVFRNESYDKYTLGVVLF